MNECQAISLRIGWVNYACHKCRTGKPRDAIRTDAAVSFQSLRRPLRRQPQRHQQRRSQQRHPARQHQHVP